MKKASSLVIVLALCSIGYSQSVKPDSIQRRKSPYFFLLQTGALLGDKVTFTSSTIHGIHIGKRLRVGAGVGFDSYEDAQALPVFGSASWDLFGKKNTVFVQMNYGWAPWAWAPAIKDNYGFTSINGGEMFSAMIGYRICYGDVRMAIQAGYKHQKVNMRYDYPVYYYPNFSYSNLYNSQRTDESMNRFAMSIAIGWR